MKRLIIIFLTVFICSFSMQTFSQTLETEKTYEITGKSKRGALANVEYDEAAGIYTLYYLTKSTDKLVKYQIYKFDKEFNFVDMQEFEEEVEKFKTKYKWFYWNGEIYSVHGNFVEPNLMGTLILKEKIIHYKYDWLVLGYHKEIEILQKVKPKTDDGRKLYYLGHTEDDVTGDITVLCGIKANMSDMKDDKSAAYRHFKDIVFLKFNSSLEIVKEQSVKFEYPQQVAFVRAIGSLSETEGLNGMTVVFAPMGGPGITKFADPEKTNYTYVRVDKDLNIVDNIKFKSNQTFWKIEEQVQNVTTDDIYLFGPSALGKDSYYNQLLATVKFKSVQLMKISNHKVEYLTETDLEQFEAKLKAPPSQKKSPAYSGKKFQFANYKIASNGDFFVMGQNLKDGDKGTQFLDVLTFHFDGKGELKSQYGLDILESNQYAKAGPAEQMLLESSDNKSMFWLLREIRGIAAWSSKPLTYPRIGKIDLASGDIADFVSYGKIDKEIYYLDPKFPMLQTDGGNKIVFFGSDKAGKNIWFCRVNLQK